MKYIRTKEEIYDLTIKNNDGSFNIQVVDYVSKKIMVANQVENC